MNSTFSRLANPLKTTALVALISLCSACATPGWRDHVGGGWSEAVETGTDFKHRTLFKPGSGDELHIYIEGDGDLWRTPDQLSVDPTPEQPLTLQLMQLDPAPALMLGRPCYFETGDRRCEPNGWTAARYSPAVVASMNAVAARWAGRYRGTVLIGYSGGGALAVLMAPGITQARAVVTLAANLDTPAWVRHHGYNDAIVGASLNPNAQPPLPTNVAQWHYAGERDTNVLPEWIAAFSARQDGAHLKIIAGFDHRCCWDRQWPALLAPAIGSENVPAVQNSRR